MLKFSIKNSWITTKSEIKEEWKGPYQPNIIVRLLGYTAVFIAWLIDKIFTALFTLKVRGTEQKMWFDEKEDKANNTSPHTS
jgi:hypothetical protein